MQHILLTIPVLAALTACGLTGTEPRPKPQPRGIPYAVIETPGFAAGGAPVSVFGPGGAFEMIDAQWSDARKASTRIGGVELDTFRRRVDIHEFLAFAPGGSSQPVIGLLADRELSPEALTEIRAAIPSVTACGVGYVQPRDLPGLQPQIYIAFLECD